MKIIITRHFYNGDYGIGSIFEMVHTFELNRRKSTLNTKLVILTGNSRQDKTSVDFNMPVSLSEQGKSVLEKLILKIQNNEIMKDEEYNFVRLGSPYVDVKIDRQAFKILHNDPVLADLLSVLNCSVCELMIEGIREKLFRYNKFVAQPGDLVFIKTQCDGCVFQNKADESKCEKYEQKPSNIIESKSKCDLYRTGNEPW